MGVPWWNGIGPASTPGMATAEAANSQPRSAQNSVRFQRLEKVSRTSRLKAATRGWPAEEREHGREQQLIAANKKTREKEHQGARIEARSARRNHSSFSCAWVAFAAYGRATTTSQTPARNRRWAVRTISRSRRRTRLRTTAVPMCFGVTNPARNDFSSFTLSAPRTRKRPRSAVPCPFTRANSAGRMSRFVFGKESPDISPASYHSREPLVLALALALTLTPSGKSKSKSTSKSKRARSRPYSKSLPADTPREDFAN
jgi:hypothetical protein